MNSKGLFKMASFVSDIKNTLSTRVRWSERTVLHKAYTVLIVTFLIALLPMPYSFYASLRVAVCISLYFFFQAVNPHKNSKTRFYYGIIALFIIYNPILPLHIGLQPVWAVINALTLYFLYKIRMIFDNNTDLTHP